MEQNRNFDFDSDVEVDSLKDAVWRLTTRVYLLEDFIAERFGEVIGPSGFTKSTSPFPGTSRPHSSSAGYQNTPSSPGSRRKRKKRGLASNTGSSGKGSKIQKNERNETTGSDQEENVQQMDFEQGGNSLLIPKDEVFPRDGDDGEANDYFLNEKSDDDNDPNDSTEKDPDFDPSPRSSIPVNIIDASNEIRDIVPQNYTLIKSSKGNDLIVDAEKNTYGIHKTGKGGKKFWRCNRYYDIRCKGRCYTLEDQMFLIAQHSHVESVEDFTCREIKMKVKEMALTTTLKKAEIVSTVLEGVDEAIIAKLRVTRLQQMVTQLRHQFKKKAKKALNPVKVIPAAQECLPDIK